MDWIEILWRFGWAFSMVVSLLIGWIGWSVRRQFVSRADFDAHVEEAEAHARTEQAAQRERDAELEGRVIQVELKIEQVPTKEMVHELQLCVTRLEGTMGRLNERLDGAEKLFSRMESVLQRQEDYLLNKGNGR